MLLSDGALYFQLGPGRSFANLTGFVSSARILNLHQLWRELAEDEAYGQKPFFHHPLLNRCILLKHNLERGEEGRFGYRRLGATKLAIPLDSSDLGLGCQVMIVGQGNFIDRLTDLFDYTDRNLDRDLKVLSLVDALPTLDPYLLMHASSHYNFDIDPCYFRIPQSEAEQMEQSVRKEVKPLAELSLGGRSAPRSGVDKLCDLLIHHGPGDVLLEGLREGLHMSQEAFSGVLFSWKALMFYKQRLPQLEPWVSAAIDGVGAMRPSKATSAAMASTFERVKSRICEAALAAWEEANDLVDAYDQAYASLIRHERPGEFRAFLVDAQNRYAALGLRIARLDEIAGFWREELRQPKKSGLLDEMAPSLMELERGLALDLSYPTAFQLKTLRTISGLLRGSTPDFPPVAAPRMAKRLARR